MSVPKPTVTPRWADGGTGTPTNVVNPPEHSSSIVAWAAGPFTVATFVGRGGNYYIVTSISGTGTSTTGPTGTGSTTDNPGANQVVWAWVTTAPVTKDSGWLPGQQPPAQWFNWIFFTIYTWILWIQDIANQNFTSTGANPVGPWVNKHAFTAPVSFGNSNAWGGPAVTITAFAGSGAQGLVVTGDGTGIVSTGGQDAPGVICNGGSVAATGAAGCFATGSGTAAGVLGFGAGSISGAVTGANTGSGPGVLGASTTGPGVYGQASSGGAGLFGTSSTTQPAISGDASGGTGTGASLVGGVGNFALAAVPGSGQTVSSKDFGACQFGNGTNANPAKTTNCGANTYGAPHITKAWASVAYNAGAITWDGVGIASIVVTGAGTASAGLLVTFAPAMASTVYAVLLGGDMLFSTSSGTNYAWKAGVKPGSRTTTSFVIQIVQIGPGSGSVTLIDPSAAGPSGVDFDVKGRHF